MIKMELRPRQNPVTLVPESVPAIQGAHILKLLLLRREGVR